MHAMHALRLRKGGGVPGSEKLRQARRRLQLTRQRASRGTFLLGLRTFLTADSFMYGPLLDSPPPPPPPPQAVHVSSDSERHTPETEQDGSAGETANGGEDDTGSQAAGNHGHVQGHGYGHNDDDDDDHLEAPRGYRKTFLSYQRMTRAGRTVVPLGDGNGNGTPTSTAGVQESLLLIN